MPLTNVPENLTEICSRIEEFISTQNYLQALKNLLNLLLDHPTFKEARERLVEIFPTIQQHCANNPSNAIKDNYQKLLPYVIVQWRNYANEALQKGNLIQAEARYNCAAEINRTQQKFPIYHNFDAKQILYQIASIKFLRCEFELAGRLQIMLYEHCKRSQEKEAYIYLMNCGEMQRYLNKPASAIDLYNRACAEAESVGVVPNHNVFSLRGIAHWFNNDPNKAARDLQRANETPNRGSPNPYLDVLQGLVNNQYDEIITKIEQDLKNSVYQDPESTECYLWIGRLNELKQNYSAAAAAYQTVLNKYPRHQYCLSALEKLEELRRQPEQEPPTAGEGSNEKNKVSAAELNPFLLFVNQQKIAADAEAAEVQEPPLKRQRQSNENKLSHSTRRPGM